MSFSNQIIIRCGDKNPQLFTFSNELQKNQIEKKWNEFCKKFPIEVDKVVLASQRNSISIDLWLGILRETRNVFRNPSTEIHVETLENELDDEVLDAILTAGVDCIDVLTDKQDKGLKPLRLLFDRFGMADNTIDQLPKQKWHTPKAYTVSPMTN